MLFVHLTDIRHADSIRKKGLLVTAGIYAWRYGRGVFCVPLMNLQRLDQGNTKRFRFKKDSVPDWIPKGLKPEEGVLDNTVVFFKAKQGRRPSSTVRMWQWWMKEKKIRRPAAVFFRVPSSAWPGVLFLDLGFEGPMFMKACKARRVWVNEGEYDFYLGVGAPIYEFRTPVYDERHLGKVMEVYNALMTATYPKDIIQLMFETPIPPKYIDRIVPLSQTNWAFREKKARAHKKEASRIRMMREE